MAVERLHEPTDGMAFVVRLLNSWDELEPDPELLRDPAAAARLLRRHGFDDAAARVDDDELEALRELRTRVRAAWGAPDDDTAVALLNALAAERWAPPTLVRDEGGGWAYRWDRGGAPASAFAPALCAATLLEEIRAHGRRRLGSCAGAPCRCVFVDRSRSRTRRYCCDLCADRVNQTARRRRLRGG
ncbi:MAG TPA: CGNR zinc finger domain-containing protein [Gaiellaceae bacterium]|nr:CGNR zinc finger domain-containing protein [Gaiellaceae bacterium]